MRTERLANHVKVLSGFAFKSNLFNTEGKGTPIIRIRDVVRGRSETYFSGGYDDRYLITKGDYLIGMDGEFNLARWDSEPALLNQRVCKIDALSKEVDRAYLGRFLPSALKKIEDATPFVTVKHLSVKALNEIQIPLPPLAEQKRIAGILDAADALRAKRREALAQLDSLLQSTFLDLFGDPVTNPMGWPVVPFHQIGKFISGATPSKEREDFWVGDVPWVSPKDMKRDFIDSSIDTISQSALNETNIKLIEANHLLIVVRGMILAHSFPAALNTCPVTINQDMKAIKPNESFLPLYLLRCMKSQKRGILAMISEAGHGTKKFDQKSMEATNVPVPPLPLQQKFAAIVESVERQKTAQRAHLAELDALFAALQHRAFRGEL